MTEENTYKALRLNAGLADRPAKWSRRYAPGWERRNNSDTGCVYWTMWTHKGLEILQYQIAITYRELLNGGARLAAYKLRYARHCLRKAKAANVELTGSLQRVRVERRVGQRKDKNEISP